MNSIKVRPSTINDIASMVILSKAKRLAYEKVQPKFWCYAKDAETAQTAYFKEMLADQDHILLIAEHGNTIQGFVIGKLIPAPAVYDPGGLTLLIDDFCVANEASWQTIGAALLAKIKELAKDKGAMQVLVICGTHDATKNEFLTNNNLESVTQLYTGRI